MFRIHFFLLDLTSFCNGLFVKVVDIVLFFSWCERILRSFLCSQIASIPLINNTHFFLVVIVKKLSKNNGKNSGGLSNLCFLIE